MLSWLRLQQASDWTPHPYWMYTKCFGSLRWCGWAYESTVTLLGLCRWGAYFGFLRVHQSLRDVVVVMSWLRLQQASGVVHANVGQNVTRVGPSFGFFCTKSYIRRSRDVTRRRREPQHTPNRQNRQNRQKHRDHGGRAALLSSDVELMVRHDRTCGRPVHGVGRGRGQRINVEKYIL